MNIQLVGKNLECRKSASFCSYKLEFYYERLSVSQKASIKHTNVDIGTEATQFPRKGIHYINGIFVAVYSAECTGGCE